MFLSEYEKTEMAECINKSIKINNIRWGVTDPMVSEEIEKVIS